MPQSRLILTAFAIATLASSSPIHDSGLQALEASALYVLQTSLEPSLVWLKYKRFLLSLSRATPLLLYFTPASPCYDGGSDEDLEADSLTIEQGTCRGHHNMVEAAVELAAETLSTPQLFVVRIDVYAWPKMLDYHLMSKTPSLLWIPGRASGHFQRYPYAETNFMDLSINGSMLSENVFDNMAEEAATRKITAFVRLCQERSGYFTRNANGRLSPRVLVDPNDESLSMVELSLIVALLAFVAFVIIENRAFVLGVVQTRLFWFILCLIVIYVALSGSIYSIVHRQAWFYFSQMHGFVLLYPNSRRQFVLEGLIHGTWSFWMSMGLMSIADVASTLKSHGAREDVIRWSLFLIAISYMALHITFLMKYPWLS